MRVSLAQRAVFFMVRINTKERVGEGVYSTPKTQLLHHFSAQGQKFPSGLKFLGPKKLVENRIAENASSLKIPHGNLNSKRPQIGNSPWNF